MKQRIVNKKLNRNLLIKMWMRHLIGWYSVWESNRFPEARGLSEKMAQYDLSEMFKICERIGIKPTQFRKFTNKNKRR